VRAHKSEVQYQLLLTAETMTRRLLRIPIAKPVRTPTPLMIQERSVNWFRLPVRIILEALLLSGASPALNPCWGHGQISSA
jgi:hypothetical protein